MSVASIIAAAEADAGAIVTHIDIPTLLKIAQSAEAALPAIEGGIISAVPYVQAFVKVLSGQAVTDADWAALDARLDAGSDALQQAAQQPDPNAPQSDPNAPPAA